MPAPWKPLAACPGSGYQQAPGHGRGCGTGRQQGVFAWVGAFLAAVATLVAWLLGEGRKTAEARRSEADQQEAGYPEEVGAHTVTPVVLALQHRAKRPAGPGAGLDADLDRNREARCTAPPMAPGHICC